VTIHEWLGMSRLEERREYISRHFVTMKISPRQQYEKTSLTGAAEVNKIEQFDAKGGVQDNRVLHL
jgi:hypothetical protein